MNTPKETKSDSFELMDCALITLATGKRAVNLRELRDRVWEIEESSLYYHFYELLLRPSHDDPEFHNDFAIWAKRSLHDNRLAEKMAMLDPLACCTLDELRQQLVDIIEDHLDEMEHVPWARPDDEFHFLTSKVVVFDTGRRFRTPPELGKAIRGFSTGSIFYHFIDSRRRSPLNQDDFTYWLEEFGDETAQIRESLEQLDYYFWTLPELRERLARRFDQFFEEKKE